MRLGFMHIEASLPEELNSLRAQLAKLGGSEDSGSAGILVPKGKVPEASLQYIRAYHDLKYNETIFEILAPLQGGQT